MRCWHQDSIWPNHSLWKSGGLSFSGSYLRQL